MKMFIDDHRDDHGVEPICKVLPIAPSTYHNHAAIARDPDLASDRAKRDAELRPEVQRVWDDNHEVYGVRKVWRQMQREDFDVARCTVERLMKQLGIQGVIRGKTLKTTHSNPAAPCPRDHVNRQFSAPAPNMLWVSDLSQLGRDLPMLLLSSMYLPGGLLVGACHVLPKLNSSWMLWNRLSMIDARFNKTD